MELVESESVPGNLAPELVLLTTTYLTDFEMNMPYNEYSG